MQEAFQLINSPLGFLIYILCAILIGMSKGGIQNIGVLALPLFAFLFGTKHSTGVILILLCFADIVAIIYFRKVFLWKEVKKLLPTAFIGIIGGVLLGRYINDSIFKTIIGTSILLGIFSMFWLQNTTEKIHNKIIENRWYSPLFGVILGFTTMIGNAAGPTLSVYMLSKKLNKITFAATSAWFIMILNLSKVPLQAFLWKNLNLAGLYLNLLALPFVVLGVYIGIRLLKILSESKFHTVITWLVIFSALLLIVV